MKIRICKKCKDSLQRCKESLQWENVFTIKKDYTVISIGSEHPSMP